MWRILGWGLLGLVGVFALSAVGSALGIIYLPFFNFQKKVDLNYGIIEKTYGTEYCLANYEWFKDTFNAIQQLDVQISTQQQSLDDFYKRAGDRKDWTFEDKQLEGDLIGKVNGLRNIKSNKIGQYNSRTEQLNRVACQELPLFINL